MKKFILKVKKTISFIFRLAWYSKKFAIRSFSLSILGIIILKGFGVSYISDELVLGSMVYIAVLIDRYNKSKGAAE